MFSLRNFLQNNYGNQPVKFKQHCFLFRKLILYLRQFIEILKGHTFNYYANFHTNSEFNNYFLIVTFFKYNNSVQLPM